MMGREEFDALTEELSDVDPEELREIHAALLARLRDDLGVSEYELGYEFGRRGRALGLDPHPEYHPEVSQQGYLDGYSETERLS